jgi:hypothetical protein
MGGPAGSEAADAAAEEVPLAGYATLATLFASGLAVLLVGMKRDGLLPRHWSTRDLIMTGIATGRLARIVTRDQVTRPLRAPFTEYEGTAGAGETRERPRGRGLRRAIGTLLTCPFCAAPWIATASVAALVARPRQTRFVQAVLVSVSVADFVQQLYAASRRLSR